MAEIKTNFIDLDALNVAVREFGFKGKRYTLRQMTMKDFIASIAREKADPERFEKMTPAERVVAIADDLVNFIDGMSLDTLHEMSLEQITALLRFARGDHEGASVEPTEGR
jgi:hypothetical protein